MLIKPLAERRKASHQGLIERTLELMGATAVPWMSGTKCCGTFLSVTMPDQITSVINEIVEDGINTGADCIVTACTMCQLNLEMRCSIRQPIPTLHMTEILSIALGNEKTNSWFHKHLVNPKPVLKMRGIVA